MTADRRPAGPRCVALIGPQSAGKTSLAEALLSAAGAIPRKGTIKDGNTVGDSSDEARARQMSTEVNMARFSYLGENWSLLDCPGAVELSYLSETSLMVADAAVVVCEPVIDRIASLQPVLRTLNDLAIPHMVFINKMDNADIRVRDLMAALQEVSARKLVLRQVPIRDGEDGGPHLVVQHHQVHLGPVGLVVREVRLRVAALAGGRDRVERNVLVERARACDIRRRVLEMRPKTTTTTSSEDEKTGRRRRRQKTEKSLGDSPSMNATVS
ncbi:MAG: GTP-binding protein [Pseudomonadota bacterium]